MPRRFCRCPAWIWTLAVAFSVMILGGCAALAPVEESHRIARGVSRPFSLEGRFSLRYEEKSYSGRLSWRHAGAKNTVLLASPFGQGIAEIATDEYGARLTASDGRVYSAPDTETLTRNVLGYPLPLELLTDWVQARGTSSGGADLDTRGRPLRLRHEDWRIDYGYDSDDPQAPPTTIFAERAGGVELRLRIDEWNDGVAGDSAP